MVPACRQFFGALLQAMVVEQARNVLLGFGLITHQLFKRGLLKCIKQKHDLAYTHFAGLTWLLSVVVWHQRALNQRQAAS